MTKVTVLLPVYNAERYLSEAIESILAQTFTDFELLIINDGSTDRSKEVIASFDDSRIRYFENEKNLRLIQTLNKGLHFSSGKYIARMDADDIAHPQRLEKQVAFMEANLEIGVCGSWMRTTKGNLRKYPIDHEAIKLHLFKENALGHPTVIIRRKILIEHRLFYCEKFTHVEDYELWVRCLQVTKLHNLPEDLVLYRVHNYQVSTRYMKIQEEQTIKVRLYFLKFIFGSLSKQEKVLLSKVMKYNILISVNDFLKLDKFLTELAVKNHKVRYFDVKGFQKYLDEFWLKSLHSIKKHSPRLAFLLITNKQLYKYGPKVVIKLLIKSIIYKRNILRSP